MFKTKMIKIALQDNTYLTSLFDLKWIQPYDKDSFLPDILIGEKKNENVNFIQIIFAKEIQKNENNVYYYNLQKSVSDYIDIICEVIRDKICAVHVFGDSHSIITCKVPLCRENWLGFNTSYPLTMFRFGNEGLNLFECIKVMGNGHENFPIRKGDIAMYSYGEIDVRYLILKHSKKETGYQSNLGGCLSKYKDIDIISDKLINNYIKQIKKNEITYGCKSFVYDLIPPAHITSKTNLFTGTLEERKELYKYFREKLHKVCKNENIDIISIYNEIVDIDGFTKKKCLQGDGNGDIHLKLEVYYLIRDKLLEKICYNRD